MEAPAPAPAPDPALAAPAPEPAPAAPAKPPGLGFKLESPDGKSSLKLGVLLQPQFSAVGDVNLDSHTLNLFVRRARILVGGNLFGSLEYFIDTDFADMMKSSSTSSASGMPPVTTYSTTKNTPGMNVQDAFITVKVAEDAFKVDAGYMLPPMAHNAVQGAGTLYSWDYFAYRFQHSGAFGTTANPVGRDAGLQLRGLVLENHLEYRVGLFQGLRDAQTTTTVHGNNMFRATGRVQVNVFEPETGFFYAGSYLGAKSILSIGGAFDIQDDYKYFAGDVFADVPVGPGVVTAQLNVAKWDGGDFLTLAEVTAIMAEAGFHFTELKLSPIVRFETLNFAEDTPDQTRLGVGLAWWPYAHNFNLKAFYTNLSVDDADHAANLFNVQAQLYVF